MLDPAQILRDLTTQEPVRIGALPRDQHGIYALHDHTRTIPDIGDHEGR